MRLHNLPEVKAFPLLNQGLRAMTRSAQHEIHALVSAACRWMTAVSHRSVAACRHGAERSYFPSLAPKIFWQCWRWFYSPAFFNHSPTEMIAQRAGRLRLPYMVVVLSVTLSPMLRAAGPAEIAEPRRIERNTSLVVDGRKPALIAPANQAFQQASNLLIEGLKASGITIEPVHSVAEAEPARRTVVCLGSMIDNPLIEQLYWNRYTFVDASRPGAGGYLLHIVFDPYPFNGGKNVIVIGANDATGARLGVARFLALVKNGQLPYVFEVGPNPIVNGVPAKPVVEDTLEPSFLSFLKGANGYLKTGDESEARRAISALELMVKQYAPGGLRANGTTVQYQRLPFDEEMASWEINCAWDAFEEIPLLNDAQRLKFTNVLLKFTRELRLYCSEYNLLDKDYLVMYNHTSFPLLGLHFGARYFERYYRLSDMPGFLEKARIGFGAQARSWKPEEDADSYITYTMSHVTIYSLAEQKMDFFTSGMFRKYADYIVSVCDNAGRASGFGDAGAYLSPTILTERVLPLALWWTKSGEYRWLMDRFSNSKWPNLYTRDIVPEEPVRFTGVNVFRLDEQVYKLTQTKNFYSPPVIPAEVPIHEAFDKVVFRENWTASAQYLVLDGLARGRHLHYDGNSITEFVEGGERWLLDHDYLTQNSTEHTMLTVMRNDRAESLMPALGGITSAVDLPGFGYTRTYMKDFNGCDWQRQIVWRKGGWFLVADTVSPRTKAHFAFDLTWKTIDCDGQQGVNERGEFLAERASDRAASRDVYVVDDALASGGKAVQLDSSSAEFVFQVKLPRGQYTPTVISAGNEIRDDLEHRGPAVLMTMDDGSEVWLVLSGGAYGRSTGYANPESTPKITVKDDAVSSIRLAPSRVRSPVRIDRVIFSDASGAEFAFEAEDLLRTKRILNKSPRQFWIKPVDTVASWVSNHEREGIPVPVSVLHQRQEGHFDVGQHIQFASLMYTNRPEMRRQLDIKRVANNFLVLKGSDPGCLLTGDVVSDGLNVVAEAGWMTGRELSFAQLRRFSCGKAVVDCSAPVDLVVDLLSGHVVAQGPKGGAQVSFITSDSLKEVISVPEGRREFQLSAGRGLADVTRFVDSRTRDDPRTLGIERVQSTKPKNEAPLWTIDGNQGQLPGIKHADLGDGLGDRLFVYRGNSLSCISLDGRTIWKFFASGRIRDVAFGDLRPSQGLEIVVGSSDTYIYLLSATGALIEKHQMSGGQYARSLTSQPYGVYQIAVGRFSPSGQNEIVVTMNGSYDLQVLSSDWKPLWAQFLALHGSKQVTFADLNGDGQEKTLMVGDKYGNCVGTNSAFKSVFRSRVSIGDVVFAVASFDGGVTRQVVAGSSGGDLVAVDSKNGAKPLWRFDNFGYAVNRLRASDLDGDGRDEILVASGTGQLYVLDGAGKIQWSDHIGYSVNDVLLLPTATGTQIAYCDESGLVRIANAKGRILRELRTESAPRAMLSVGAAGRDVLILALANGQVAAYPVR